MARSAAARKPVSRRRFSSDPSMVITLSLPSSVVRRLNQYADKHNKSRSKVIAHALDRFLGAPSKPSLRVVSGSSSPTPS